ncbi:MAG: hypothetical protein QN716_07060 [Nitrososphaeraceae archaeon]|nr:hypothetical protein [Nitrososphaeraceae archaeon]
MTNHDSDAIHANPIEIAMINGVKEIRIRKRPTTVNLLSKEISLSRLKRFKTNKINNKKMFLPWKTIFL